MPNQFLTAQLIARRALPILMNNLVFQRLVFTDYANTFAKAGDTIQVRRPAVFSAQDFTGTVSSYQDIQEIPVLVKMDKFKSVDVKLSSKELALNLEDFSEQVTRPAMVALAEDVDANLAQLYEDIPYNYGSAGTTPSTLADIAGPRRVLNVNRVPVGDRRLVMDPFAEEKLGTLDSLVHAEKSGTTIALRQGSLGRVLAFETFMDQNIKTHTKGTLNAAAVGTGTAGNTTLEISAGAASETLKKGDIITIATVPGSYVITADVVLAGATGTAVVYPAWPSTFNDQVITVIGSHTANLAFHRLAFGYVSRPLEPPLGGARSATLSFGGLSIRIVFDYDMDAKTNVISYDILYGTKTLYPELAARLLG